MSWINRLERRLEPYAITNISLLLVIGQTFVLLTSMLGLIDPDLLILVPSFVKAGEWWRLFSFVLVPPPFGPLGIAFTLYMFYLYGSALEQTWGAFRFNLLILSGCMLTAGFSFLAPYSATTNIYIMLLVGLGFATLNPNFEVLLFFVLPVRVKWLGVIVSLLYLNAFISGGLPTKLAVAAAVVNFVLFFGGDLWRALRQNGRHRQTEALGRAKDKTRAEARHTCVVCGRSDVTNPELDFRYSADDRCYCTEHLPSRKQTPAREENADA